MILIMNLHGLQNCEQDVIIICAAACSFYSEIIHSFHCQWYIGDAIYNPLGDLENRACTLDGVDHISWKP